MLCNLSSVFLWAALAAGWCKAAAPVLQTDRLAMAHWSTRMQCRCFLIADVMIPKKEKFIRLWLRRDK